MPATMRILLVALLLFAAIPLIPPAEAWVRCVDRPGLQVCGWSNYPGHVCVSVGNRTHTHVECVAV